MHKEVTTLVLKRLVRLVIIYFQKNRETLTNFFNKNKSVNVNLKVVDGHHRSRLQ